jgi:hypothetical protein
MDKKETRKFEYEIVQNFHETKFTKLKPISTKLGGI